MVDWLAGNRIRGTSTERTSTTGFNDVTITGGWKEVGRTTLPSASSTITVSISSPKQYYMILCPLVADASGGTDSNWRFNGNSSGYNWRYYYQGQTADTTATNQTKIFDNGSGGSRLQFSVSYIANVAGKEKLMIIKNALNWTSGASGSITRKNIYGKWTNTDVINSIQLYCSDGGGQTGDEVVVLGWDGADTHTDNFWSPLANVNGGGTSAFNTGTFTAKKYLWIQAYIDRSGASNNTQFQVGNATLDTSSHYVRRRSEDGGTDEMSGAGGETYMNMATYGNKEFHNFFVINRSGEEKMFIINSNLLGASGVSNPPHRLEGVYKWTETDQINIVGVNSGGANTLSSDSFIKVWGSD
jgi:hypothetical protein